MADDVCKACSSRPLTASCWAVQVFLLTPTPWSSMCPQSVECIPRYKMMIRLESTCSCSQSYGFSLFCVLPFMSRGHVTFLFCR